MLEQPIKIQLGNPVSAKVMLTPWRKAWYSLRAKYRQVRISKTATDLLGPQYRRSRNRIEIDITYMCNLRCQNCNRSISQAPEKLHISLDMIKKFVSESIAHNKHWKVIRVLGGEPTLHPEFQEIVSELLKYRKWEPSCSIIVVSNGNGRAVNAALDKVPSEITIENTSKVGNIQPGFGAFNHAPIDDPAFADAEYHNGCDIMDECGMGLTPLGYYPCAVAGGIDRIAGKGLGYSSLPSDDDDMKELSDKLCRLCGHFRDGHCVPQDLRAPLLKQETSITWTKMFDERKRTRSLLRQGSAVHGAENFEQELEKVAE
jgi:hypothetical protein